MEGRSFSGDPNWESLSHAYGPATDTPQHLEALRSADGGVRREAWGDLIGSANHQGDLYPVTRWIVGPLLDLAVDPSYPDRVDAAAYVTLIVEHISYYLDRTDHTPPEVLAHLERQESRRQRCLTECRNAAVERASDIVGLVRDDDPEVKTWALRLVGALTREGAADVSVIHGALTHPDPLVRAVALWQMHISASDKHEVAALAAEIATQAGDTLDGFIANAVLLAADRNNRNAAREVLRLEEPVWPDFESAGLNHVAESPLVFAVVLAGIGSEIELETLAR